MTHPGQVLRTRREVLIAGMAGAFGLALAACGPSVTDKAVRVRPAGSDIGAIDHVVFLMNENRSFDHYYGTYHGVRGFSDPSALADVFVQAWDGGADGYPESFLLPFHLDTLTSDAECTYDLSHEWNAQHMCWAQGAMDAFVATHTSAQFEGPGSGVLTMGYYTRQDLPYWYSLADAFTICDNYHCSVLGPTHPNRLYAWSGTLDPAGEAGGPILVTNSSSSFIGSTRWKTMPEELESNGISWKVYNPPGSAYQPGNPLSMAVSDNILLYFQQHVSDPSSPLYQRAFGPLFPADFRKDVARDELPSVSWIIPPVGYDEHPPAPPAAGQWFVNEVLSALVSNPKVWAKTVLFIMYDENDGFFDHVPPPVPGAGTADEFVNGAHNAAGENGITGPIGFGFRVPLLVVSPFSRGGYVCSDLFDHTSQLRFLEERFGVVAPNLSAWRRRTAGDLTSAMDATRSDMSVPS
ncbi:MAG TPA: alkaline phosphatase family protein, partial [Acidimicrobiales bacterium]|nr:alkaline phosphatase family protein [Acidimicrobiales bacterium]